MIRGMILIHLHDKWLTRVRLQHGKAQEHDKGLQNHDDLDRANCLQTLSTQEFSLKEN